MTRATVQALDAVLVLSGGALVLVNVLALHADVVWTIAFIITLLDTILLRLALAGRIPAP